MVELLPVFNVAAEQGLKKMKTAMRRRLSEAKTHAITFYWPLQCLHHVAVTKSVTIRFLCTSLLSVALLNV